MTRTSSGKINSAPKHPFPKYWQSKPADTIRKDATSYLKASTEARRERQTREVGAPGAITLAAPELQATHNHELGLPVAPLATEHVPYITRECISGQCPHMDCPCTRMDDVRRAAGLPVPQAEATFDIDTLRARLYRLPVRKLDENNQLHEPTVTYLTGPDAFFGTSTPTHSPPSPTGNTPSPTRVRAPPSTPTPMVNDGITRPRPAWTQPGGPIPPFITEVPSDFEERRWNIAYIVHGVGGLDYHEDCNCTSCLGEEKALELVWTTPRFWPGREAPNRWGF